MADELSPAHPLFGLGYAKAARTRAFLRLDGDTAREESADVAEEVPVAIAYNNRPHVVMMATPADYEDFAVGFTLTEEIVPSVDQIQSVTVVPYNQGVEIQVAIPQPLADALADRGRQLVGRTGCGLCGVQTITDALRPPRTVAPPKQPISPNALWNAEAALWDHQTLNQATAAVHAAAWATWDGKLVVVREDVGRHNALDKVIGALARGQMHAADGFIVMTSRASYELVQKISVIGVPLLAAVSRPSGLAIRLAESAGIAIVGLLRGKSANVYTHREHISHA
jgi:FdhD protein